jgi:uncharacterized membrane protein
MEYVSIALVLGVIGLVIYVAFKPKSKSNTGPKLEMVHAESVELTKKPVKRKKKPASKKRKK